MKSPVYTLLLSAFIATVMSPAYGAVKGGYEKELVGPVSVSYTHLTLPTKRIV